MLSRMQRTACKANGESACPAKKQKPETLLGGKSMDLISYSELKNHLLSISVARDRALLCLIYASMSRVGEITYGRYTKTRPFAGADIHSFENRIELYVKGEKGGTFRKVPVFRNREQWLVTIIENWRDRIGDGPLFPFSTQWAQVVFKRWFPDIFSNRGGNPDGSKHTIHWLRGWRYSHYRRGEVTGSKVESKVASLLGGWVSSAVPERFYDLTKIDDHMEELENVKAVL